MNDEMNTQMTIEIKDTTEFDVDTSNIDLAEFAAGCCCCCCCPQFNLS